MSRILLAVALIAVFSYGIIKAYPLLRGPEIVLNTRTVSANGILRLEGTVAHTKELRINEALVLVEKTGAFTHERMLPHGTSLISLTATDRFERTRTLISTVYAP